MTTHNASVTIGEPAVADKAAVARRCKNVNAAIDPERLAGRR